MPIIRLAMNETAKTTPDVMYCRAELTAVARLFVNQFSMFSRIVSKLIPNELRNEFGGILEKLYNKEIEIEEVNINYKKRIKN